MRPVDTSSTLRLESYAAQAYLASSVAQLRERARELVPRLKVGKLWMVNSTATGGGVAEMLPRMVAILRELGVATEWAVIETDRAAFFDLTKKLHNLIHGAGSPELPADARAVYETVQAENTDWLRARLRPNDVLVVHDPQPMGLGARLAEETGVPAIWRCHIGLEEENEATSLAWDFLRPYAQAYRHAVFTAPEYVPPMFAGRASIISPGLDPLSHKNRNLRPHKLVGVLSNAGLFSDSHPVLTPPFPEPALRLAPNGTWIPASASQSVGFLFRPTVLQISRWDRLKGFVPLLEAFLHWKTQPSKRNGDPLHQRRREITRLVLAGPDPSSVADDPEGREVVEELIQRFASLEPELQQHVAILSLPMSSTKQNALIVNALQRSASLVVQNSIQEGFGLTILEAMWKRVPVLASSALGPRRQIEPGVHGRLIRDPEDRAELADAIDEAMHDRGRSYQLAEAGEMRVYDEFLVFTQIVRWLETIVAVREDRDVGELTPQPRPTPARAPSRRERARGASEPFGT